MYMLVVQYVIIVHKKDKLTTKKDKLGRLLKF